MSAPRTPRRAKLKGNINHSACRWCYKDIPLDDLCVAAKEMGLKSIDLLGPKEFPTLQKHGLVCAMVNGVPGGITSGLNRVENHDKIVEYFRSGHAQGRRSRFSRT